ncbi:hypothetical protein P3W45_001015 [Vairimorpha bombi]|jgi:hypothetical protein
MHKLNLPGPKNYKCEYCKSRVHDNYCSTCRSHFILTDNEQKYVSVEMDELDHLTISDKLCYDCTIYYNTSDKIIKASCFTDYLYKLKLCKKCKEDNQKFIRNMFYKNFILYRCRESVYTHGFIMLFVIFFFIFNRSDYFYHIYFLLNFTNYSYLDLLVCLGLFYTRKYCIFRYTYLGFNCFSMSCKNKFYFYMPVNLEKTGNIDKHIEELKI